ncbi:MAG: hypothetical protein EOO46_06455 [Flavobacterium sp.]|nr:MAG: hypothetical protein EOO46_06455 [Flavobacterium sp.]
MKTFKFYLIFFSVFASFNFSTAQSKDKTTIDVENALKEWNQTAKEANLKKFMNLFDDNSKTLIVGSDKGEIFEGKKSIEEWLGKLFKSNSFEWEMQRINIDHSGKTAWVFVNGFMIVTSQNGEKHRTPYRFTGVLVKVKNDWKWRLFDGSVPESE